MLLNFDETSKFIEDGGLLHIAGNEGLLRKLPKGKWIGGSTEYFMTNEGGKISSELLFVTKFYFENFNLKTYDALEIENVTADAFDNGFSIAIIPFDSEVHRKYSENASNFKDIFTKHIVGWIAGLNLQKPEQIPIAVNGITGEVFSDKAVVLHLEAASDKMVAVNIVNIFEQDENSPVITFREDGFMAKKCFVDGEETAFADYIKKNNIDIKLPLIGDYSGARVNTSFKAIENDVVSFYAPVFSGIKYQIAKNIPDYATAFGSRLEGLCCKNIVFSCNCILNFLYGEFEGKSFDALEGPITFGEVAYQLVNQTLVYVTVD